MYTNETTCIYFHALQTVMLLTDYKTKQKTTTIYNSTKSGKTK